MPDYDSPWKEALDLYFEPFLALLFPIIHAALDWARGYESLDKEFQQLVPEAEQGRRYVDKLLKVWTRDGAEQWLLIHVEVQTTRDADLPLRMYVYNYRVFDRYNRQVVSLSVLADDEPNWRPSQYATERWGCRTQFDFPSVKLLDFVGRETELETSTNRFAPIVLAHLKAIQTREDPAARQRWKVQLIRGLFKRGFSEKDIRQLFRLIDWLMELPPPLTAQFWEEVKKFEEERKVPFITTPERMIRGEGRREGILLSIEDLLQARFGEEGLRALPSIQKLEDEEKLRAALRAIFGASTLEEASRAWTEPGK